MILCDNSIVNKIESEEIYVDPLPTPKQIQPASLDVRLGRKVYDPKIDRVVDHHEHILLPGKRYLGTTQEVVELPNDIAAQLAGRSSVGRQGVIVHKTAGWIDPGFRGEITLELMNLGDEPVELGAGDRVAQLVFFPLNASSEGYDGSYQLQTGPTKSKLND